MTLYDVYTVGYILVFFLLGICWVLTEKRKQWMTHFTADRLAKISLLHVIVWAGLAQVYRGETIVIGLQLALLVYGVFCLFWSVCYLLWPQRFEDT